jgi:asparagine synthase (glutamine-hydrolysing)
MCGIAGFLNMDGSPLPPEAAQWIAGMNAAQRHRGPDGEGCLVEGPVALGHRRLSIIDLSGGAQPMSDASGRIWVSFNGELYNYREVREDLRRRGHVFRTESDTEVLLNAWAAFGADCLDRLEGMFAFALWDGKERELVCARDRFGKKPLYYTAQKGRFVFASELSALRQFPGLSLSVPPESVARYLAYEYVPTPQCIYREVSKLPPSHFLRVRNGELRPERYWRLPVPEPSALSEEEAAEELRRLLGQAVRRRLVSDVPLGVFLSGGIDSSVVTGLMASMQSRVNSFSIGFTEAGYDESSYSRLVAARYGTNHVERILSAGECAGLLPVIATRMDEPMADSSAVPTYLLSEMTREKVTVALGGDGADELFAGYEHYQGCKAAGWYRRVPLPIRRVLEPLTALLPLSESYINPRGAARIFLSGTRVPPWLTVQTWLGAVGPELQRTLWRHPDPRLLDPDRLYASTRAIYDDCPHPEPLAKLFHLYIRQYMPDDILVKVDRCSMMHSLEVRAPFLDRDLAAFVSRLPLSFKLRGFRRKYLLKKACASLLPPEILGRNKRGFIIPVAGWLRGALRPLVLELLGPDFLREQGLFSPEGVGALVEQHLSGRHDHRKALWTLLTLQLWWRHNRPSPG